MPLALGWQKQGHAEFRVIFPYRASCATWSCLKKQNHTCIHLKLVIFPKLLAMFICYMFTHTETIFSKSDYAAVAFNEHTLGWWVDPGYLITGLAWTEQECVACQGRCHDCLVRHEIKIHSHWTLILQLCQLFKERRRRQNHPPG